MKMLIEQQEMEKMRSNRGEMGGLTGGQVKGNGQGQPDRKLMKVRGKLITFGGSIEQGISCTHSSK